MSIMKNYLRVTILCKHSDKKKNKCLRGVLVSFCFSELQDMNLLLSICLCTLKLNSVSLKN